MRRRRLVTGAGRKLREEIARTVDVLVSTADRLDEFIRLIEETDDDDGS